MSSRYCGSCLQNAVARVIATAALLLSGAAISGCGEEVSPVVIDGREVDPKDVWYERTHVTLSPDGNHTIVVTPVSLAQQIAEQLGSRGIVIDDEDAES